MHLRACTLEFMHFDAYLHSCIQEHSRVCMHLHACALHRSAFMCAVHLHAFEHVCICSTSTTIWLHLYVCALSLHCDVVCIRMYTISLSLHLKMCRISMHPGVSALKCIRHTFTRILFGSHSLAFIRQARCVRMQHTI